jgi:hypothetical protein
MPARTGFPPGWLSTEDVAQLCGFNSVQAFQKSTLYTRMEDKVSCYDPTGGRRLVLMWSAVEVHEWAEAVQRHRGLVALGKRPANMPLADNLVFDDTYDYVCDRCNSDQALAPDYDWDADMPAGNYWCPNCGVVPPPENV